MDSLTPGHCSGPVRVNGHRDFYALVSYIPEPLGGYLNRLRAELIDGCRLQSHVTLLPPRMLRAESPQLVEELSTRLSGLAPFEIALGEIEVFETTGVIYIAIERGWAQLMQFHSVLETGIFWFEEYYPFHPHITLAQGIDGNVFEATLEKARDFWQRCPYPRTFQVEDLTFVRNVDPSRWDTISEHTLARKGGATTPERIVKSERIPAALDEPFSLPRRPVR